MWPTYHHKLRKQRSGILVVRGNDTVTIPLDFKPRKLNIDVQVDECPLPSCNPLPQNDVSGEIFNYGIRITWNVQSDVEVYWTAEK